MTSGSDDDPREPAWHERTSTLLAASAAAIVAIGLVYFAVSALVTDDPEPTSQYFMEPSATSTRPYGTTGTTTTTTQTVTSTSPPMTTDINDPNAPSSTTSTGPSTSSDSTTTSRTPRSTRDDDDVTTTRSRPRLNETRTLYPRP